VTRWAPVLAALLAAVAYAPSLGNGFALDDQGDIVENSVVQPSQSPIVVVLSPYRGHVPPARSPYRPLTSLTMWLNAGFGGAWGFHATNVLLHAFVTGLVTLLLLTLGAGPGWALGGGAVFAVHPVHVEAVANVIGRGDVLMTMFTLLGVLAFLDRTQGTARRAAGVAIAYALALLSKENGIALPGLLVILAWLTRPGTAAIPAGASTASGAHDTTDSTRSRLVSDAMVILPTVAVLIGYLALRYQILGTLVHVDTAPYITTLSPLERTTTAIANVTHTMRLLLVPWDLSVDYGPAVVTTTGLLSLRFAAGLGILVFGAVGGFLMLEHDRRGSLAVAWIAVSTFVVSNLAVGIGVWVAERTLYLPSVGVVIAVVALATFVETRPDRRFGRLLAGILVLAVVAGTWRTLSRIPSWQSTDTVLDTLADEHPESFRSQWWVAQRLTNAGDPDRGLEWFDRAIETNPNDYRLRLDRVRALLLAGRSVQAEEAVAGLPGGDPARFVYLAQSLIMQNRPKEASDVVHEGLMAFPRDVRLIRQANDLGLAPGARE
jgi:protein O-mannosyl-transferase